MKKILLISGAALSMILIVFLTWFFLFRDKTVPAGEAVRDLLPFGSGEGFNAPGFFSENEGEVAPGFNDQGIPVADLFRITDAPVAGVVAFTRGGQSVVRYVERATGHITEVVLPSGEALTALAKRKITNTTIPKVYEAHFSTDGSSVLLRFLRGDTDLIENRSLTLTPPSSTSTEALYGISAANLRGDITDVAVGSGNALFYSLKDSDSIVTSLFNGSSLRTIFTSAFTDWDLKPVRNGLMIQTKASEAAPGYAYTLNTANGALSKILGPLTALSITPDSAGARVFYSYIESGFVRSAVINTQNRNVVPLSPATLAEKCVWSANRAGIVYCAVPTNSFPAGEPDNWYMGKTSFSERIWAFDINAEIAQVLVEPKPAFNLDLDVIEPILSPNEEYLLFINKLDLSLWAFRLPEF